MISEKYKDYRRLYPKLRLSWTLYRLWVHKDWIGIWDYLLGRQSYTTAQQSKGIVVHEHIEKNGHKNIIGIEKHIKLDGYREQIIELNGENNEYLIICKPDLWTENEVVDWKSGRSSGYEQQLQLYMWALNKLGHNVNRGLLVELDADLESMKIWVKKVKEYERSEKNNWDLRMYELYNDIINNLPKLDKYLNY